MKVEQVRPKLWSVRKQVKGKRYQVYFDHRPSQKEVLTALAAKIDEDSLFECRQRAGTVGTAADEYIRKAELSPTTKAAYNSIVKNTPQWFLSLDLADVDSQKLQMLVDVYGSSHSAKSTKNLYGLYTAVLARKRPSARFTVDLPKIDKKRPYEPKTDDIRRILEYEDKSERYGLVFRLLALGLRRGEACALTAADLDEDNILTINKAMIYAEGKHVVKDSPKTDASCRRILIPADTAERLRQEKTAYTGAMSNINRELHKAQEALGIPSFRLHTIRHFAAAFMLRQGFSSVQIEDYMGWEHGSQTMQKVYAYSLDPHESQKDIADAFGKL